TIVNGGDAGTTEGDFASCLVWSSRAGRELPMLIIVTNNEWGISTPYAGQHPQTNTIADRARGLGIRTATLNGNDVEESWLGLQEAMSYIRKERKPYMIEARVSRLYGHSSATGCNFITEETDCLAKFEQKLEAAGVLSRKQMDEIRENYNQQMLALSQKVKEEPMPDPSTIYDYVYTGQKGRYW
ncbi:MAG: thiamine pyrophosphate-dependent enzyme, partial [Bdellovibrionota bacterium]